MKSKGNKLKTFRTEWIIKNVSVDDNEKNRTEIKKFDVKLGNNSTKWNLNVTLNKELNALDVHLYKKKVCSDNFVINFVIKLGNNEFQWEKKASELDINWGWPCLMRLDVLFDESKGYIDSSRRLKLFIEMKLTEIDATAQLDDSIASVGYVCETCSYYFENQAYSDLTLICCDDVALPIHRVFLAKKSPVFKKLFDAEMHENKITLQDIKAETMKEVLRFIYCGTTDVDEVVMTTNVLYAAAQYEIADLIDLCIDGLMKKIDKDNVMAILDIAVAFNHEDLEKKCLDIILKYYKELKSTEKWNELKISLVMKIMDAALNTSKHLSSNPL